MKLILGLGNIGKEYDCTNHNAGFMVIDKLAESLQMKFNKRGCDADYAEGNINGEKIVLGKPRTYMNSSGLAAKSLLKKFKIEPKDMLVLVDDIDLDKGKIRIRNSGSAGSHNGLKSIIAELGTENFARVRIGIGKPAPNQDLADFVLSKMKLDESQLQGLEMAADAAKEFVYGESLEKIMQHFNGK